MVSITSSNIDNYYCDSNSNTCRNDSSDNRNSNNNALLRGLAYIH